MMATARHSVSTFIPAVGGGDLTKKRSWMQSLHKPFSPKEIASVASLPRNDQTVVSFLGGSEGSQTQATEAISLVTLKMQTGIASLRSQ
jgi:hypothetical protein